MPDSPQLATLTDVEIFAVGVHRGIPYTLADLQVAVRNFQALCTGERPVYKPTVVVGHEEDQQLIEDLTGYPASGVVVALRLDGERLMADFGDVLPEVADLIRNKVYRQVSSELYDDFENQGKSYGKALRRVALLGAELPQVKGLLDLPMPEAQPEKLATFSDGGRTSWSGTKRQPLRWCDDEGRWFWNPPRPVSKFAEIFDRSRPRLTPQFMRRRIDRLIDRRRGIKRFSEQDPAVVARVQPSVVSLEAGSRRGAGAIVHAIGHRHIVATCNHVIAGEITVQVRLHDGRTMLGIVSARDFATDLALVSISSVVPLPRLTLFSRQPSAGDSVFIVGAPRGLAGSVARGSLSKTGAAVEVDGLIYKNLLVHDCPAAPGNSGGPLLNTRGEMIGLNTAHDKTSGLTVAIPTSEIVHSLQQLKS